MGELSPTIIGATIFCVLFLASFAGLITLIGSQSPELLIAKQEKPIYPNYFGITVNNSETYADSMNYLLNSSPGSVEEYPLLGDRYLYLALNRNVGGPFVFTDTIMLSHRYGLNRGFKEDLDWYDQNGRLVSYNSNTRSLISSNELDATYEQFGGGMNYTVKCAGAAGWYIIGYSSAFQLDVKFSFNTVTYSMPSAAWDASALNMWMGIYPNQTSTGSFDVWRFIGDMLTFKSIQVVGFNDPSATFLNWIIAIPIIVAIAIIAICIIVAWIPF